MNRFFSFNNLIILFKKRIVLLIIIVNIVAITLVFIAMAMYASGGSAQVDLSRPGYKDIRSQVVNENVISQEFPSTGELNNASVIEFNKLFDKTINRLESTHDFSGNQLNDEVLGL